MALGRRVVFVSNSIGTGVYTAWHALVIAEDYKKVSVMLPKLLILAAELKRLIEGVK